MNSAATATPTWQPAFFMESTSGSVGRRRLVLRRTSAATPPAPSRLRMKDGRYVAMQMAMAIRRRSIGLAASVPYTSHPFWASVPAVGGVGRLPATVP